MEVAHRLLKISEGVVEVSLDLGKTTTNIAVTQDEVVIGQQHIAKSLLEKVKDETCYHFVDGKFQPIAFFSKESNKYYKLVPTTDWPTIKISSTPMHRHTHISPKGDTRTKIKEISPVRGKVLDTCCGLGYTAILANKQAQEVHTFEQDPYVLHVTSLNPYGLELFNNKKIIIHQESIVSGILSLLDSSFDRIIHDPPTFKYAPELYNVDFHKQLYRVLKHGGILYHYCPEPGKTKGKQFHPRVLNALKHAGFVDVAYHLWSSGIRARK